MAKTAGCSRLPSSSVPADDTPFRTCRLRHDSTRSGCAQPAAIEHQTLICQHRWRYPARCVGSAKTAQAGTPGVPPLPAAVLSGSGGARAPRRRCDRGAAGCLWAGLPHGGSGCRDGCGRRRGWRRRRRRRRSLCRGLLAAAGGSAGRRGKFVYGGWTQVACRAGSFTAHLGRVSHGVLHVVSPEWGIKNPAMVCGTTGRGAPRRHLWEAGLHDA